MSLAPLLTVTSENLTILPFASIVRVPVTFPLIPNSPDSTLISPVIPVMFLMSILLPLATSKLPVTFLNVTLSVALPEPKDTFPSIELPGTTVMTSFSVMVMPAVPICTGAPFARASFRSVTVETGIAAFLGFGEK